MSGSHAVAQQVERLMGRADGFAVAVRGALAARQALAVHRDQFMLHRDHLSGHERSTPR